MADAGRFGEAHRCLTATKCKSDGEVASLVGLAIAVPVALRDNNSLAPMALRPTQAFSRFAWPSATVRAMLTGRPMAHREFQDDRGRLWEVWDVIPERRDRRSGAERRKSARETFDRRKLQLLSVVVKGDLAKGWLVFTSTLERRRYAPLPEGWAEASTTQLWDWCAAAKPLPPPRRLIE